MGRARPVLPPIAHSLDGGKKLGLDWETAEEDLTNYHNYTREELLLQLRNRRLDLLDAEAEGRESKAKKLRRRINQLQEAELALHRTWCPTCSLSLRDCKCPSDPFAEPPKRKRMTKRRKFAQDVFGDVVAQWRKRNGQG